MRTPECLVSVNHDFGLSQPTAERRSASEVFDGLYVIVFVEVSVDGGFLCAEDLLEIKGR